MQYDNQYDFSKSKTTFKFEDFARSVREDIKRRDTREEELRLRKVMRAIRYWEGRQLGWINDSTGKWNDVQVSPDDPFYPNNQIRFFCRSILKEMSRSRSSLGVQPRDDRIESAGAARLIRATLDRYREEHFAPLAAQTEAMFALLEGNYFRYLYWDATIDTYTHTVTDYDLQTIRLSNSAYYCDQCGSAGEVPEGTQPLAALPASAPEEVGELTQDSEQTEPGGTPGATSMAMNPSAPMGQTGTQMIQCPVCGAPTEAIPPVEMQAPVPTGTREVPTGDAVTEIVDPMEIRVHLRARNIQQTPYLDRIRLIHYKAGKRMFPHWSGTSGSNSDRYAVRVMTELEGSPGNYKSHLMKGAYGRDASSQDDLVPFEQIWLDTMYYYDIDLEEDFNKIPGKELKAGTLLLEQFGKGLYLAFLGDELVDYRMENKADHWTHGSYLAAPQRFWGDGAVDDSLDQQWELNNLDSLMVEHIMFNVGGQTWYNQLKIEGSTLGARPRERNPMRNPSPNDNPGNFIYERPGIQLSPEVQLKQDQIKRDMQAQFGSFSTASGMPDVNVSTATGMAILRDQALGFLSAPLELRGEVDVEWAYQLLKLLQENMVGKRYMSFGQYDDIEGQWFEASDIRTDFQITQIPGTWFPVSDFDWRQRASELATFGGVPLGIWNPQWSQEVRTFVLEKYNMPIGLNATEPDERKQKIELEKMRMALSQLSQAGGTLVDQFGQADPLAVQMLASVIPPEMFIDNDDVHIMWIERYLKTDDGMNEDPVIREALKLHQQQHLQNKMQAQQMLAVMEGIGNGSLQMMPDGSVQPTMQPPAPGQKPGGGKGGKVGKVKETKPGVNSPTQAGSGQTKKVGANLPLARAGATAPGSQPATVGANSNG